MNIKKAETDIAIARSILSKGDISEYEYDAAAYHIQQAIEKSLKYYLSNVYGEDETRTAFKTHKIGTLLARCFSHGMNAADSRTVCWNMQILFRMEQIEGGYDQEITFLIKSPSPQREMGFCNFVPNFFLYMMEKIGDL